MVEETGIHGKIVPHFGLKSYFNLAFLTLVRDSNKADINKALGHSAIGVGTYFYLESNVK